MRFFPSLCANRFARCGEIEGWNCIVIFGERLKPLHGYVLPIAPLGACDIAPAGVDEHTHQISIQASPYDFRFAPTPSASLHWIPRLHLQRLMIAVSKGILRRFGTFHSTCPAFVISLQWHASPLGFPSVRACGLVSRCMQRLFYSNNRYAPPATLQELSFVQFLLPVMLCTAKTHFHSATDRLL